MQPWLGAVSMCQSTYHHHYSVPYHVQPSLPSCTAQTSTHTTCPKYHCFFRTTLEIVEEAFCCFDASADGYLEREEVEHALITTSTPGR